MNHKEKLKYLKEYDPITYYEMRGDPTGHDVDAKFTGCFYLVLLISFICGIITAIYLFL